MAPTCTSNNSRSEEDSQGASSSAAACSTPTVTAEELDGEPFYGMFDRHADDDVEGCWAQLRLPPSPRTSIPEASETFQRVMRQLDGIEESAARAAHGHKAVRGQDSEKRERKCCQPVKKAASFSTSDCQCSSSSSTTSKDSSALAAEAKRRRSVPCMAGGKHVQWADEAGVADLVSVRLIRPRLLAKGEKEEAQVSTPRSILKRLTGIH